MIITLGGSPDGGAVCPTHHQEHIACPPGHLQHPMSQEGQKDHQGHQHTEPWQQVKANIYQLHSLPFISISQPKKSMVIPFLAIKYNLYLYFKTNVLTLVFTVEVGSLHKLRLESLKLIFQPLHKFLVNKLQFCQFGQDI